MINNCSRSSCSPRGCWILTAARTFLCILHQVRKWQSLTKPGFRGHQSQQWMTKIPLDHNYQEIGFWGPESIEIFQLLCCLKCFQLNFDVWCQSIIVTIWRIGRMTALDSMMLAIADNLQTTIYFWWWHKLFD